MSISVNYSVGKIWNGASWDNDTYKPRIGLNQYASGVHWWCMTVFALTMDKNYSSVTLNFALNIPYTDKTEARYDISDPNTKTKVESGGTATTFYASGNTITLQGDYKTGDILYIYVWGRKLSGTYDVATVTSASADGAVATFASIGTGTGWGNYKITIGTGSGWSNYLPSFGTGTGWEI